MDIQIERIIEDKNIVSYFQPIVSIVKKSIIGIEVLTRGIDAISNEIIPPNILIKEAKKKDLCVELDRLCRKGALNEFSKIKRNNKDMLLFLNINSSILDKVAGSSVFINMVKDFNLNPNNIVIEILESEVLDFNILRKFIKRHKKYGFIIALDDMGSGFSNLDRILLTEPDIIKIDKKLVRNINNDFLKQEIFKSLVGLSKKIGALTVAEGIESEKEALTCLELGADMLQGFYFSKPGPISHELFNNTESIVKNMVKRYKQSLFENGQIKSQFIEKYRKIINIMTHRLKTVALKEFEKVIDKFHTDISGAECIYVLDSDGIQVTSTLCNYSLLTNRKSLIFQPANIGTDHSLKKYYFEPARLMSDYYITEPYISLATGSLALTMSHVFIGGDDKRYYICVDFRKE